MNQTTAKDQHNGVALATKIILIALCVIALVVIVYSVVNSFGVFGRLDTAAKSDNYKISENSLCLYKYQAAQQEYYYTWLYDAYGMTQYKLKETYGDVDSFLNYMIYNTCISNPHTFDEQAYSQAEYILTYCEAAREAGVKLEDADKADVDTYIDNMKAMADANKVKFSAYLKSWVGEGVSERDCRKALELSVLATKYQNKLTEEKGAALTEEEISKHVAENKANFYSTKYTYYPLVNETLADKAKECSNADEVKEMIVDYYMEQKFESNYKALITDAKVETEAAADETRADVLATIKKWQGMTTEAGKFDKTSADDKYVAAGYNIATAINTEITSQFGRINENGSANYADPNGEKATDLQKWLFADGRAAGDTNVIATTTSSTDSEGKPTTTTTYTWYMVGDVMKLDTDKTRAAYYALLADDAEGVENRKTADEKWNAFNSGDKTAEAFAEAFGASLNESLSKSSLPDELGEWLFNEARKENDFDRKSVKSTTDGTTADYVIFYVKENEENWKISAKNALVSAQLSDEYNVLHDKYHVTVDYTPETEAATEAATKAA